MIPKDRIESFFLLFGIVVGVLFVLDGWRGSRKAMNFRASPRIRAFGWVIGGLIGTFVVDIKKVGVSLPDEKSGLIAEYLFGFAGAAALTLLGFMVIFLIQMLWSHRERRATLANQTGFPFLPIADYLHYGFYRFQKVRQEGLLAQEASEVEAQRQFLSLYIAELATGITEVNRFREIGGDPDTVARMLLRSIAQLVEKRLHPSERPNVNYMRAYKASECPAEVREKCRFMHSDEARYSHFLAMVQYASDVEREIFTLPVEIQPEAGKPDSILPGAPFAFRQNRTVSVEDTGRIDYPKGLPGSLAGELKGYFAGKNFKSFLCIPILGKDGMPVGVLNIDSHRRKAFGTNEDELESNFAIAIPFCMLLGAIIPFGGRR